MKKFRFRTETLDRYVPYGECSARKNVLDRKTGELMLMPTGEEERYPSAWANHRCTQLNRKERKQCKVK